MKRLDPKAAALSVARGVGASLAKPLKRAAGGPVEDTLLDSTGKPVHHTPEGVENFRKQFKDTQAVDGKGRPLRMYHGSPEPDLTEISQTRTAHGHFFTPDPDTAAYYTGKDDEGKVYESYLNIKNLADFDDPVVFDKVAREAIDYNEERDSDAVQSFVARLYKEGYGKHPEVTKFFDAQSGIEDVGEHYPIENLLSDNYIDADEIDSLVAKLPDNVKRAYDEAAPVRSKELEDAEQAYGSQDFYMHYQDDFMRAAQSLGYDGVVLTDPSSTGESVSYVVFDPGQIKSATDNDGTWDHPTDITKADGGSVVSDEERQRNLDEFLRGNHPLVPPVLYTGTTGDFTEFKPQFAHIESDLGGGFYSSNSKEDVSHNYAGEGPDLTGRLERKMDELRYTDNDEPYTEDELRDFARQELNVHHQGLMMPIHVSMKNPAVLGGEHETHYDFHESYDKETDEYGEPTGSAVKLAEAFRSAAKDFDVHSTDIDDVANSLIDYARYDGLKVSDAERIIKRGMQFMHHPSTGDLANAEIFRSTLERMGHDGIIDTTVDRKFGSNRQGFGGARVLGMVGVTPETIHYVAFKSGQIKSALGNDGTYDHPTDIMKAEGGPLMYHGTTPEAAAEIDRTGFDVGKSGSRQGVDAQVPGIWFSSSEQEARRFGPQVLQRKPALRNPFKIKARTYLQKFAYNGEDPVAYRDKLMKQGYDGLHITAEPEYAGGRGPLGTEEWGVDNFVVFDPASIAKAAGGEIDDPQPGIESPQGPLNVYHGTPFTFAPTETNPLGEFDPKKIGSGEGNQAFGYGVYLAEEPAVAKPYTQQGLQIGPVFGDVQLHPKARQVIQGLMRQAQAEQNESAEFVYGELIDGDYPPDIIKKIAKEKEYDPSEVDAALQKANEVASGNYGRIYTVEMPRDMADQMMHWDKTWKDQHPRVKELMSPYVAKNPDVEPRRAETWLVRTPFYGNSLDAFSTKKAAQEYADNLTGEQFYNSLVIGSGPMNVSRRLAEAGVPGIKYFDARSRRQQAGTHNYVVFPTHLHKLKIAKDRGGAVMAGKDPKGLMLTVNPDHADQFLEATRRTAKAGGGEVDGDGSTPAQRNFNAIGLYSHAAEAALKLTQPKGSLKQLIATLKNQHGVKDDEINNAGIKALPQYETGEPVTRDFLHQVFKDKIPNLHLRAPSGGGHYTSWTTRDGRKNLLGDYKEQLLSLYPSFEDTAFYSKHFDKPNVVVHLRTQDLAPRPDFMTNFDQYDLNDTDPDGTIGRQTGVQQVLSGVPGVLVERNTEDPNLYYLVHRKSGRAISFPEPPATVGLDIEELRSHGLDWVNDNPWEENDPDFPKDEFKTVLDRLEGYDQEYGEKRSSLVPNFKKPSGERADSIKLLDELQSDWGQLGRDNGFEGSEKANNEKLRLIKLRSMMGRLHQDWLRANGESLRLGDEEPLSEAHMQAKSRADKAAMAYTAVKDLTRDPPKTVPQAPYVGNIEKYTDVALKHLLQQAAKEDRTHVVWTPSKEQIKRYADPLKNLDGLFVQHEPITNSWRVKPVDAQKQQLPGRYSGDFLDERRLKLNFGSALTKIITQNDPNQLATEAQRDYFFENTKAAGPYYYYQVPKSAELAKGGHQLQYDTVIPKRLLALAREHDPEAELSTYDGDYRLLHGYPALKMTDRMKESIKQNGFKAFRRGGKVVDVNHALRVARKAKGGK